MRILITDDSKVARISVKRSLPKYMTEAEEIQFATNGQEAVDKYKEQKFDLLFMDLTMPVMDGYEATRQIMEYDDSAYIIVVTADIQNSGVVKALENGARSVIEKPIDSEKLNKELLGFLKHKEN